MFINLCVFGLIIIFVVYCLEMINFVDCIFYLKDGVLFGCSVLVKVDEEIFLFEFIEG